MRSRAAVAATSSGGVSSAMPRTMMYAWSLLLVWLLAVRVESIPQRGPVHSPPSRLPVTGPFRAQTMSISRHSPPPPSPAAPRPTMQTASISSLTPQSRVARPVAFQGSQPRPPPFPNPQIENNRFPINHNQFPGNNGVNGNQFPGNIGISVNHNQFPGSFGFSPNHNQFPGNVGIPPNQNQIPAGDPFQKYKPPNDSPQYTLAQSAPPASIQPQIPPQAAFLKTYAQMYQHYSPSHNRIPSYPSHHHHHHHDPVPHYHSQGHYGHYGHHHGHHHHHRAPSNELLDLMSPLKKEDAMFPPSSNHPGSLYGIMVPLMLLGISIPAIGFVYTYFSRRSFNSAIVHNILPSEEKLDYYFHILQRGIECFQNSDKCSTKVEHARLINSNNSS